MSSKGRSEIHPWDLIEFSGRSRRRISASGSSLISVYQRTCRWSCLSPISICPMRELHQIPLAPGLISDGDLQDLRQSQCARFTSKCDSLINVREPIDAYESKGFAR